MKGTVKFRHLVERVRLLHDKQGNEKALYDEGVDLPSPYRAYHCFLIFFFLVTTERIQGCIQRQGICIEFCNEVFNNLVGHFVNV